MDVGTFSLNFYPLFKLEGVSAEFYLECRGHWKSHSSHSCRNETGLPRFRVALHDVALALAQRGGASLILQAFIVWSMAIVPSIISIRSRKPVEIKTPWDGIPRVARVRMASIFYNPLACKINLLNTDITRYFELMDRRWWRLPWKVVQNVSMEPRQLVGIKCKKMEQCL